MINKLFSSLATAKNSVHV